MSVERSPTTSGATRPTTRSNPCINSNRARTTNDEGEQTINPRIAADGAYIIPGLEERRDNTEFFDREQPDSPMEQVARSILLGSVDRLLHHELYVSRTSFGMVMQLKTRLRTINRAAQLNRWFRLNRIPTTLETNIPELATTYWNAFADFLETGLDLNKDNLLGIMLQSSIPHNTDLRNEFDKPTRDSSILSAWV
ncbi:hypothetical protein MJO28_015592 [Puccinia striiformis f. sp. tritici]|uniref:Uncharacterized protein n=3 Tax=Puccinia striiformis TaxID=27350 RepID=A0A2S4W8C0_9BASI|nr:hypothetical protein MJO28_015592 [Puccinia striiformis f. sp. tritici]POW18024.1 hypothetical protein PSTT_00259 [Puccinia striiformis]